MKKASDLDKNLEFTRKTEESWKRIEAGKGKETEFDEFIQEIIKW